jgi:hypothetical protein
MIDLNKYWVECINHSTFILKISHCRVDKWDRRTGGYYICETSDYPGKVFISVSDKLPKNCTKWSHTSYTLFSVVADPIIIDVDNNLTVKTENPVMFIKYIRVNDGNNNKYGSPSVGRPIGCIAMTSSGDYGISLHNKTDMFDKRTSKAYAVSRAIGMEKPIRKIPTKTVLHPHTGNPIMLDCLIDDMVSHLQTKVKKIKDLKASG